MSVAPTEMVTTWKKIVNLGGTERVKQRIRFVTRLLRSRWALIAAAIWIQCCSGSSYDFGIYSESVKVALGYDQANLNTLAIFKDLGANVGILAGCIFDFFPPAGVLAVGAAISWAGYFALWASISTAWVPAPHFWQTCLYIFFASNGQTFFNTACVVTCVQRFPNNRGVVIGLLKGLLGLSGAIMSQCYHAVYAEGTDDGSSFLLLVAGLPSVVALALMPFFHQTKSVEPQPQPTSGTSSSRESKNLYVLSAMAVALAAYLMAAIVLEGEVRMSRAAPVCVCAGIVAVLLIPAVVAFQSEKAADSPSEPIASATGLDSSPPSCIPDSLKAPLLNYRDEYDEQGGEEDENDDDGEHDLERPFLVPNRRVLDEESSPHLDGSRRNGASTSCGRLSSLADHDPELFLLLDVQQQEQLGLKLGLNVVRRGDDHTLFQALCTVDFWLMFAGVACGMGAGVTAIDNIGQIGLSFGYTQADIGTFVSLLSIWNFLGRFGFGVISEYGLHRFKIGRPMFLVFTQIAMVAGFLLMSAAVSRSLYFSYVVVGLCYGAQWSIVPAITSEVFGLARFATLFNTVTIASPLGAYFLSVQLAGRLYDKELGLTSGQQLPSFSINSDSGLGWIGAVDEEATGCYGAHCFRLTFIVLTGISILGAVFYFILARRTARFYSEEIDERISSKSGSAARDTTPVVNVEYQASAESHERQIPRK